jgi:hypothetical protein
VGSHERKPARAELLLKLAEAALVGLLKDGTSPVPSWVTGPALKVVRVLLRRR